MKKSFSGINLKRILLIVLAGMLVITGVSANEPTEISNQQCVILLHGLARTENSMNELAVRLTETGFKVVNQGYPSRDDGIQQLANSALPSALKQCENTGTIHFVTHSMGGILLRAWLSENTIHNMQHVVMLGPPNGGSEVVDKLANYPGFSFINGSAGAELGTDENATPQTLPPANFKLGIIAGNESINPILSVIIPGEDDGKVAVERTKLVGMVDHIVLPVTHTFMMRNKGVIEQTRYFLQNGRFFRDLDE